MPLDVKRLRVLRELAERGTVAATAEALSFTPSAVSQELSALERAEADLHAGAHEVTGTLRVAAFSSFARSVLPGVTAAILRDHPRLDVHVRDAEPQDSIPL